MRYLCSSLSQRASAWVLYLQPPQWKAARLAPPLLHAVLKSQWGLPGPSWAFLGLFTWKGNTLHKPYSQFLLFNSFYLVFVLFSWKACHACLFLFTAGSLAPNGHSRNSCSMNESIRWQPHGAHNPNWSSQLPPMTQRMQQETTSKKSKNSMRSFQNTWTVKQFLS